MSARLVDQVLAEFEHQRVEHDDPVLEAVRMAILLEDVLGVTLRDEQIDPAVVGDPVALRALLVDSVPRTG